MIFRSNIVFSCEIDVAHESAYICDNTDSPEQASSRNKLRLTVVYTLNLSKLAYNYKLALPIIN